MTTNLYNTMIINKPAYDWLTLTTYNRVLYAATVSYLHSLGLDTDYEKSRVMQYKGMRTKNLFYGAGEQNEHMHYMVTVSGNLAGHVGQTVLDMGEWSITRFDLQVTLPLPIAYDAMRMTRELREGQWRGKGNVPSVGVVSLDGKGNDTVYIGSARSKKRVRIYVKEEAYLRCEYIQRKVGTFALTVGSACGQMLAALDRVPYMNGYMSGCDYISDVLDVLMGEATGEVMLVEEQRKETRREWFDMIARVMIREAENGDDWFPMFFYDMSDRVLLSLIKGGNMK